MGKEKKSKLIFVGMLILSLMIFIACGGYFWMMSNPAEENLGYSFCPNPSESYGWTYRVNGVEMEPIFDKMGYSPSFPVEDEVCVVEASRVMMEERREGILRFIDIAPVQVYLDDRLIYTDFPEVHNQFGTILPWSAEFATMQEPRIERYVALPLDYLGKTLTIISYVTVYEGLGFGVYPELYESLMLQGQFVPDSVFPIAAATVSAVFGFILLLLFLFGMWHGSPDWSSLLLMVFAFVSMVAFSGESFPVSFAIPGGGTPDIVYFVKAIAIDILLFYFATQMKKSRGIFLVVVAAAHILLHAVALIKPYYIYTMLQSSALPVVLLVAFICMAMECKQQNLFRFLLQVMFFILFLFAVLAFISPKSADDNGVYMAITAALFSGNWMPISLLFTTVLSILSSLFLLFRYIRTQVHERLGYRAYQMQVAYQQKNMENLNLALDEARAARHEYKHHLETLRGLVGVTDQQRALEYLNSMIIQEQNELRVQWSEHPVVNVLLTTMYRKAKQLDIQIKSSVTVPEHIAISDVDLSIMMNNIIENAFCAIAEMPAGQKKFIHLKIGIVDDHIFYLGCENSYAGPPCAFGTIPSSSKPDSENHGFGLIAIQRTAEKYQGFLVVSGDGVSFKTQIRLCLQR